MNDRAAAPVPAGAAEPSRPPPDRAGVGLKSEHYRTILETRPDVGWFEVHPENYMLEGGPPLRYLEAIRADYPLSLHGVGMSLGSCEPPPRDHLDRLGTLVERFEPFVVSEHLSWSRIGERFLADLLPVPMTREALDVMADNVIRAQDHLGRRILIENPSTYSPLRARGDPGARVPRRTRPAHRLRAPARSQQPLRVREQPRLRSPRLARRVRAGGGGGDPPRRSRRGRRGRSCHPGGRPRVAGGRGSVGALPGGRRAAGGRSRPSSSATRTCRPSMRCSRRPGMPTGSRARCSERRAVRPWPSYA